MQPWTVGSSTIWARRQIQPGEIWGLNCSLEKGWISLRGAEDTQLSYTASGPTWTAA
jgi:hypothetical protein